MCAKREKRSLTNHQRFSVPGRIGTLFFSLPGLLTINHELEIAVSALFILYLYITLKPSRPSISPLRTFVWLAPALILSNALLGPKPKLLNLFSTTGALNGILISYRLIWGVVLTGILVTACPQQQLLDFFHSIFGKQLASLLTTTLQLVPLFADIRIPELRQLPDAIARRLQLAQHHCLNQNPISINHSDKRLKLFSADLLLLIPAVLCTIFSFIF
ncbi:hypothetical protein HPY86_03355 [candidate division WOR-3 bacterium]|nr:hypothetical protein [candidate division WOR-3 bacterium]